jgi:hypothetical protein
MFILVTITVLCHVRKRQHQSSKSNTCRHRTRLETLGHVRKDITPSLQYPLDLPVNLCWRVTLEVFDNRLHSTIQEGFYC